MVTIIRKSETLQENKPSPSPAGFAFHVSPSTIAGAPSVINAPPPHTPIASRIVLVDQCWAEFNAELIERKKLSNQILPLITANASQEELRDLHTKIKSYQPVLEQLHKRARHAEQYGALPVERADAESAEAKSASIDSLKMSAAKQKRNWSLLVLPRNQK
jgi:hypothetical protein